MWAQSLGQEDPLEEDMATCSSIPAWRIPWTEEPAGPQSVRSHRDRHGRSSVVPRQGVLSLCSIISNSWRLEQLGFLAISPSLKCIALT